MVSASCPRRRSRRKFRSARLHGHQTLGLRFVGEHPAHIGYEIQRDRPPKRLFPAAHPVELSGKGSAARGGFRHRMRGGHPSPAGSGEAAGRHHQAHSHGQADRTFRDPAHQRDHHWRCLCPMGRELSRPALAHQPMVQCHALGDAPPPFPSHRRVPLAGRTHGARDFRRGHD